MDNDQLIFCLTDVLDLSRFAYFFNQVHKSKFTYVDARQTVSFIIFLGCLVLCTEGRLHQRGKRCAGEEREGFETSAEVQTVLQTALQKRVASYGKSCRPDFLHLKSNNLGAKTSMQEWKVERWKVPRQRKCVLMLMSSCRSYWTAAYSQQCFSSTILMKWNSLWNEMGRKCKHAGISALRVILTIY